MIVHNLQNPRSKRLRSIWAAILAIAFAWLLVGVIRSYPTFGYYGYELTGDEWLGINSRGYRALITVTNDGSTETVTWLRHNVPPESKVISYLDDVHLVSYLNEIEPFPFEFSQVLKYENEADLVEDLATADYVVVRVVDDTGFPPPVSDPAFIKRYGTEPVFQIVRGRGVYQMSLIQVFHRLSDETY